MNDEDESREVDAGQKPISHPDAWTIMGTVLVVVVSSVIAFCCTGLPIGLVAFGKGLHIHATPEQVKQANLWFGMAWTAGFIAAIFVGYFVYQRIRKSRSNQ